MNKGKEYIDVLLKNLLQVSGKYPESDNQELPKHLDKLLIEIKDDKYVIPDGISAEEFNADKNKISSIIESWIEKNTAFNNNIQSFEKLDKILQNFAGTIGVSYDQLQEKPKTDKRLGANTAMNSADFLSKSSVSAKIIEGKKPQARLR